MPAFPLPCTRALLPLFIVFAVLALLSSQARSQAAVWKAEKAGETVYFGGTIHLLRPADFPLPEEFDRAYGASDRLFFESDLGAMNTPAGQAKLLTLMRAEPGEGLREVLSPATYQAFADAFRERGMDIRIVEPLKVSMGVVTLQVAEFMRLGLSLEGVDMHYYKRAQGDGKGLGFLETMEAQFGYLATLGRGWEDEFIQLSLRDIEKSGILLEGMANAWRAGQLDRMETLFIAEMRRDYPEAYENLLVKRNHNWLPGIEQLFLEPGTEFVLVGVAHMAGEDGLLQLLEQRGYQVSPL